MTDLLAAVDSYLVMRRGLGFKLVDAGSLLPDFVGYLHRNGAEHVSTELALAWATQPVNTNPIWWHQRLSIVRGFAEYLRYLDPDAEVPPRGLLPARQQRVASYLYSDGDIAALMDAARSLNPPLRAATYETFIGLLSVTGLRLGEALALNRDDLEKSGYCWLSGAPSEEAERCRCTKRPSGHFSATSTASIRASQTQCPRPCSSRYGAPG